MIIYKRLGNVVTPYWVNRVTGEHEKLTFKQLKDDGYVKDANCYTDDEQYHRMSWEPYYLQHADGWINPRHLKPNGYTVSDFDWHKDNKDKR